ncbi:hypothetical protein [Streptomyces sp. S.PB5]|uniref:hypothetical protein n=1 Tax=Streptomyces sp. S.PB5 TaxID=3020844 RepID=UPI0025B073C1|nr:hypothetical protein [Streptomyces sp. S.PB5]MDN3028864.1 hypothetical protein [Streptomyces sp. S.PB5]
MQMRRALATVALGSALVLGGTAATAHAAGPAAPAAAKASAGTDAAAEPGWHTIGIYSTYAQCDAAGQASGYELYDCHYLPVPVFPSGWYLTVWY